MKPLVDVVAVRLHQATAEEIKSLARETGHSRFPVYTDKIVHLEGYIDIYDVLTELGPHSKLPDVMRTAYVVPETVTVDSLLTELLRRREPAAVVIDEHGGSVGWVTLEDVIEEIVGEIEDEFDAETSPRIQRIDSDTMIVPASLDLDDYNRMTGEVLPTEEDFDTIGGLIYTRLGRVTEVGDEVTEGLLRLKVLSMDGRKIAKVRIERMEPPTAAEGGDSSSAFADRAPDHQGFAD
jgi:CBS domain containing-hemolysin-like protein